MPRHDRRRTAWFGVIAAAASAAAAQDADRQQVIVTGHRAAIEAPFEQRSGASTVARQRAMTNDTARLLQDMLGVSLAGAGGVSSLPALNGLGDDRVRTQVDGMDLVAACPNHMNSPLSYLDPSQVGSVRVFAGIAPVSVGGDSLGGTIQVESLPPLFSDSAQLLARGALDGSLRGSGRSRSASVSAKLADDRFSLAYIDAASRRDNYRAARGFKPATPGTEGGAPIREDEVGSSAYRARNDELSFAARHEGHLLQLKFGRQDIGFEGFPNQRMDMTSNRSTQVQLRYSGRFGWGELQVRAYQQRVDHEMDMGRDRYFYGFGMPMLTEATTRGASVQAAIGVGETDTLRLGVEGQTYVLYDWWPAVGGAMGPNAFWNIDYGRRYKAGAYAEWDAFHGERWFSQLGLRLDRVMTDAAAVQGYDNGLGAIWGNEAAAFNARSRARADLNLDAVALVRYTPVAGSTYGLGIARKSRAPNLYQRYPWSTQPMAALMNNFVGDGNGYIGDIELRPEVAHTLALTGRWRDPAGEDWSVDATAYLTRVHDFIDARRCDFGQCSAANVTSTDGFVLLQYVNQNARLHGFDLSAQARLLRSEGFGVTSASLTVKSVRGRNASTGDNLHDIMPLNANLALAQRSEHWNAAFEFAAVAAKTRISQVRNEIPTAGYALVNLRAGYAWQALRLEFGVENLFDRFHSPPLGGAYVGQGRSMTSAGIAWGVPVPGPGRSVYAGLSVAL